MLTSRQIENFKGIAARQRIEFAPWTLRFGANRAGKRTIRQGLRSLHEVIARGVTDANRTELADATMELGAFAPMVRGGQCSLRRSRRFVAPRNAPRNPR